MMLSCIMSVSACGKKAAHVDVPDGTTNDSGGSFPHVYPDPKTNL